jgi:hypothetical protein
MREERRSRWESMKDVDGEVKLRFGARWRRMSRL